MNTGDPRPDDDPELAALWASLRADEAPRDLKPMLIAGLAASGAMGAAGAVTKSGVLTKCLAKLAVFAKSPWIASVLWFGGAASATFVALRAASLVVDARPSHPPGMSTSPPSAPTSPNAMRPQAGLISSVPSLPVPDERVPAAPSAPLPRASAPAPALPRLLPLVSAGAPVPDDRLREEAARVREIADFVSGGRCAESTAAIGRYRSAYPGGQLAHEVAVLEGRCRRTAPPQAPGRTLTVPSAIP